MTQLFDVVVVGNAGVDTNVYLPYSGIDDSVESNFTENVDYVGQAGGYASRGFAQLGKKTAFIGYVGPDHIGSLVQETLAGDGINLDGLFIDSAGTARSVNFVFPDGRRKNFYDGKSHMTLQPDLGVTHGILSRARLAHFSIPNWARKLLPQARELGLTVSCDIQDVVSIEDPYRRDFIEQSDILFFSAVNYADPTPLIEACLSIKPDQVIVVGRGAEGCALGTSDGVRFFPPVKLETPVIDTNGAGDGLAVGFLVSYVLDGFPLDQAILRGQIAARYTCSQRAASSNLMSRELLDSYYQQLA
jgi:sugar/nucleoside kinase (ribokinase family)